MNTTQTISNVYGVAEWDEGPTLYLQTTGIYEALIERGRKALEASGAQTIKFYYVDAPKTDGFIAPICDDDDTKNQEIVCTYNSQPHCFPPENFYNGCWEGLDLLVTEYKAMLTWTDKHSNTEIWININEQEIK